MKNLIVEGIYKEDNISPCLKIEITEKLWSKIKAFTQHLIKRNYPYDTLCWALAEFQIIFEKGRKKFSEQDVIRRAKSILESPLKYEDVCQLISMLKVYLEEAKLYP
jgi:hypothetical protein